MRLICCFIAITFAAALTACNSKDSAYDKLKAETGATDEELQEGIKLFTQFYSLLHEQIDSGLVDPQEFIDFNKNYKTIMEAVSRDDELSAAMSLATLKVLEKNGAEDASEWLVKMLRHFVDAEYPSTESSEEVRKAILDYAAESPAFRAHGKQSEQGSGQQVPPKPEVEPSRGYLPPLINSRSRFRKPNNPEGLPDTSRQSFITNDL